jgi:polar amino acid transport system substrate-binding protein
MHFAATLLVIVASLPAASAEVPLFRKTDQAIPISPLTPGTSLRLLADAEFPPFSFRSNNGRPTGLSVDLALLACGELKVTCSVDMRPFEELVPALMRNDGDVIVSGVKLSEQLLSTLAMTRPYFWSTGRFAAKKEMAVAAPDPATLRGFKIGFIEGTGHAAFINKYYAAAELVPHQNQAVLLAALKTGTIDLAFGDNLTLAFWLSGSDSGGCCKTVGGAFVDRTSFSRNLAYLVRRDETTLLKALDLALDRLQDNGSTSKLMMRYIPANYW